MTMTAKRASAIVAAFIASEEMDNAARYLQAGRRLARLSDAELTPRRLPRPEHLIPAEARKRVVARTRKVARRPDVNQRLREDIEDFVRGSAARRN